MNNSVGSAIEKIKLQEQDNEAKLKERREYESAITSLHRAIRETSQHIEKSDQDQAELVKKIDSLRAQVVVARTRRDAMLSQVEACAKELDELRAISDKGIRKVWELRSSLCTAVHEVADACDIRALLIRPIQPELSPTAKKNSVYSNDSQVSKHEARLKTAIERKGKAICERDRLMAEPETGEEFMRIKNALQYSLEMINNLKKIVVSEFMTTAKDSS